MPLRRLTCNTVSPELSATVAKNIDQSALDQRRDSEALGGTLRAGLAKQGMVFSEPDPAPFQEQLRSSSFYTEWRGKFGEAAWERLESTVGRLA